MMCSQSDTLRLVLQLLIIEFLTELSVFAVRVEHFTESLSEVNIQDEIEDEVTCVVQCLQQIGHLKLP